MFDGRTLLIATRHAKEKVIAPVVERELGVHCVVKPELDTDSLGTFSGEIERLNDPLTTARNKCNLAIDLFKSDLAIASEGSFGPNPFIPFLPVNEELLLFVDRKNNLEIEVREISTETNFNAAEITSQTELIDFAELVKFPSHGIIIRAAKSNFSGMVKGIVDWNELVKAFELLKKEFGKAYLETDMRAMFNPTRMKVIEKAAEKLTFKIKSQCPQCSCHGFGITRSNPGLPCQLCRMPTNSILSNTYTCRKCGFEKTEFYPGNRNFEDPMYCNNCNP